MLKVSAQSASITEGCAPLQVQFSPPAGVNAFFWDFKNGNNSILSNPTATFTTPGAYVVEFSPGNGLPVLGTVTVNVYPKPVVSYVTDTTIGCKPLTVNFENASTVDPNVPITQTTWVFGDGGSAVDVNTISHTYTTGGTFTVSLQLESSLQGCTAIAQTPGLIQVSSIPNLAFTTQPNPAVICSAPAQVSFINQTPGSGLVFEWDFGNGQTFIGRTPPPVNYAVEGTYTVSLTAIDFIGCPETITHQVRVGPPHANFMIRDTLCWKDTTLFENLSDPGFYEWNFGPNANPSTSNETNPIVIFTEPGFVDINLKVTSADGACSADTTISVYIEKPDASFALDPAYTCTTPTTFTFNPVNENAAEYIWFFNDFSKAFDVHPTWTYDAGDDPYIEKGQDVIFTALVIRTPAGCMDTLARYDTIHTAYANFMPDVINGCAPLAVTFSDSSSSREPIIRYTYMYGDGNSEDLTTDDPHGHTFTQPGEYDVRLIIENAAGCIDTSAVITIEVGEPIAADFMADKSDICRGDTVHLSTITMDPRIDSWHFETDDSRSSHCYLEGEADWVFQTETGPKDVTLTVEYNGCFSSLTKEDLINVRGPIAKLYYEMDCSDPFTYTFRDSSYDATVITWDFGDGMTGAGSDIAHTYAATGDYTVKLTAENPGTGCAPSVDSTVVFVRKVESKFEIDDKICIGSEVDLDASQSVDVENCCWKGYTWLFEISNRPITTQDSSIKFTFTNPGMETLTLVTEDINGCRDTLQKQTTIYDIQANFSLSDTSICFPTTVNFTDLSTADTTITSWMWDFGGVGTSTAQNPSFTFGGAIGESLSIQLNIEDALGCKGQFQKDISIYNPFSIVQASDNTICAGQQVDFSATDYTDAGSSLMFNWTLGNGQTASGQTASAVYNQAGTFTATLNFEEIGTGCKGTTTQNIFVQDYPQAAFASSVDGQDVICAPAQIQFTDESVSNFNLFYVWDFGNGQISTIANPLATFDKGTYTVTQTVSTPYGCSNTTTEEYTLIGPDGDFDIVPTAICVGESATFTLKDTANVSSWTWDFGDGSTEDNTNPATHTYSNVASTGPRDVVLILKSDETGCIYEVTKSLFIGAAEADVVDIAACEGDTLILSVVNPIQGASYLWSPGNQLLDSPTSPNPRLIANNDLTYSVTVTVGPGCTASDQANITVIPEVNFTAPDTIRVLEGQEVTLTGPTNTAFYTLSWSPSGDLSCSDCPAPTFTSKDDITYFLTLSADGNCREYEFPFPIDVITDEVLVPNVFTPNNDKVNDEFRVYSELIEAGTGFLKVELMRVYNRWGELVFEGSGDNAVWDGNYKGKPAPSDAYMYIINVSYPGLGNSSTVLKGDVTLLR